MKATTIKIEGELLKGLSHACPPDQSISAYIRDILSKELKRKKMMEAGRAYVDFLNRHPKEQRSLEQWETADLASPPKRRGS